MPAVLGDLRYALRSMRANPGFVTIAVVSLALGIGANTAIFSMVDQLLLWSAPARDPATLVTLVGMWSETYPFFREYRDHAPVFSAMFASTHNRVAAMRPEGAPAVEVGHVQYVTGNYFETLGIGAAAGRVLVAADDRRPGGSPVAVLSYRYWQRRFAGDFGVVGRKLAVNGFPFQIAGIVEKGFGGVFQGEEADVFVPVTMFPIATPVSASAWDKTNMFWLTSMARLKPGVTMQKADAAMRVLWPQAVEAVNNERVHSGAKARKFREDPIKLTAGLRLPEYARKGLVDPLRAMAFASGLVLLIACANVANLLLSRAASRRREIAVRMALGATRGRLVRQLLTESFTLAAIAGVAGFVLAYCGVSAVAKARILGPDFSFHPNLAVLLFSAAATVVTGILFGLAPAFRASRTALVGSIRDGGAATQSGGRLRMGKVLVAAQVALSLTLLMSAGLFLRTLRNLLTIDLGFQKENVVLLDIDPANLGYSGHRLRTFYDDLLARTRQAKGVRMAALSATTPMGNYSLATSYTAEGYQPKPGERMTAMNNPVSPGFFATLGTPMLLGRDFREEDEPSVTPASGKSALSRSSGQFDSGRNFSRVCIIDEILARRLFPGANPLGRHISFEDRYTAAGALEIIAVVKAAHSFSVRKADPEGTIFTPSWNTGAENRTLCARVTGDPGTALTSVRRALRAIDANVPVLGTETLEEAVSRNLQHERLTASLTSLFGLLALGLAALGLHGVMAHSVVQRTREVGIRMALGASRGHVVRMIVRESMTPVLAGMAAGTAGALAAARLIGSMLYGVAANDLFSLATAAVLLLMAAVLAAALPARRAGSVQPLIALRHE